MSSTSRAHMAAIGRKGGIRSRRTLTSEQARLMVRVREARRAYREFHGRCFWSYQPDLDITAEHLPWIADQLRRHGDLALWHLATRICP